MFKSLCSIAIGLFITTWVHAEDYKDSDGAFTLVKPQGWKVHREVIAGIGSQTTLGSDDDDAVTIEIMAMKGEKELDGQAYELGKTIVDGTLAELKEDGAKFRSQQAGKATFAGRTAYRADAVFLEDGDDVVQQGTMIAVAGSRHLLVITVLGPRDNAKEHKKAAEALASILVEGVKVGGDAATAKRTGGGLMNAARLKAAAAVIKGNMKETAGETVLVEGEVVLTYASVKAYIETIEFVFDMELTETELHLAREKFVEVFKQGDVQGRQVLTIIGAKAMEYLKSGSEAEQARNKATTRQAMADTFAAQSKQGNEWATTMSEAIARRSKNVASVNEQKPKPQFAEQGKLKTQLTEADLDASMEMLYFMWVTSGRPAEDATPEAIALIRQSIAVNFSKMEPQAQYLFANAEAIYGRMRSAWAVASQEERVAYGRQFASALDEMGLTVEQRNTGSSWDNTGKSGNSLNAELAQVTAWNLAQKATR